MSHLNQDLLLNHSENLQQMYLYSSITLTNDLSKLYYHIYLYSHYLFHLHGLKQEFLNSI